MNGSFLFKIIGVSLVYMYICGTTCWVGMVSCYSSTFVVSKMCRKDESACFFFFLLSPPLPTSPLLKNVFVIILLVVRVAVPTTTAVVVAVS